MERAEQEKRGHIIQDFLDRYFPGPDSTALKEQLRRPVVISREKLRPLLEMGETIESILSYAVARGYVLHGTSAEVKMLKPQRATGLGSEHEQQHAVYATDVPAIAIFRALTQQKGRRQRGSFYTEWDEVGGTLRFRADQAVLKAIGEGNVYVLRKEDFVQEEGDFVCREKCMPVVEIKVDRDDFGYPIEEIENITNEKR